MIPWILFLLLLLLPPSSLSSFLFSVLLLLFFALDAVRHGIYLACTACFLCRITATGTATTFFRLQFGIATAPSMAITGIATSITAYHYVRIFDSSVEAFVDVRYEDGDCSMKLTGAPYNDVYHYFYCSYHYVSIFDSRVEAFEVVGSKDGDYSVTSTGASSNDAYHYVGDQARTLVLGRFLSRNDSELM